MIEAALIISVISLIMSIAAIVWLLAKQFSTHVIQYQQAPNPFDDKNPLEMGRSILDQFREIGDPIDDEELERIKSLKNKKTNI